MNDYRDGRTITSAIGAAHLLVIDRHMRRGCKQHRSVRYTVICLAIMNSSVAYVRTSSRTLWPTRTDEYHRVMPRPRPRRDI